MVIVGASVFAARSRCGFAAPSADLRGAFFVEAFFVVVFSVVFFRGVAMSWFLLVGVKMEAPATRGRG